MQGAEDNNRPSSHELEAAHVTHVGLQRSSNEDYVEVLADEGIVALADGMGGHRAGEVASEIAVGIAVEELKHTAIQGAMDTLQCLIRIGQAVETANTSVYNLSKKQNQLTGMGTTLVLLMFRDGRVYYAHVGDSRLYRLRDGKLRQLTKDHSLLQEVLDHGIFSNVGEAEEAGVGANVLTRSLGFSVDVNVDVSESKTMEGDYYLVCSDGLSAFVSDDEILNIISREEMTTEERVQQLLDAALNTGGKDNISIVLIKIMP